MQDSNSKRRLRAAGPIDIIEQIVLGNEWIFDRSSDLEMAIQVPGSWCQYNLHFSWNEKVQAIHFSCAFDMRVSKSRRALTHELLAMVNDQLWLGHFSLLGEVGVPMFRHVIPLRGTKGPVATQIEDLMETALSECDRFYPAFQYVIWTGKPPNEAFKMAIIDTIGEA